MNPENLLALRQAIATRFLAEAQPELRAIISVMKMVAVLKEAEGDPKEILRQEEVVGNLWKAIIAPMECLP